MFTSVVIPAYNEAARLPGFLTTVRAYMGEVFDANYEVLLVNDGSQDGTGEFVQELSANWPELVVLEHAANRGKGAAVRTGVLASRGELVLFSDADGATPISEERRLRDAIVAGADVAVGSRLVPGAVVSDRRRHRDWLGRTFAALARLLLRTGVRDPQCGFKMFRGEPARRLFAACTEDGYLFDLQVLVLAHKHGYRVVEVPVRWSDMPGSKLHLVRDSVAMLAGLFRLAVSMTLARRFGPRSVSASKTIRSQDETPSPSTEPCSRLGRTP